MEPIAHRKPDSSGGWIDHLLRDHLEAVGRLAAKFSKDFAPDWGHLAGLWHDLGKYSQEFQAYIRQVTQDAVNAHLEEEGSSKKRGRVNHSSAGAMVAVERFEVLGRLLAYVIAGHHAGLADFEGSGLGALGSRLDGQDLPRWDDAPQDLLTKPPLQLPALIDRDRPFSVGFFVRMLFSALVDADFLDTETFYNPQKNLDRQEQPALQTLKTRLEKQIQKRAASNLKNPTPVNALRERILNNCRAAAEWDPGFFSLTVPTGGGKTLSSLAFALDHACKHNLRRIIYVIPFTSIIEQNAAVFRQELGNDAVVEHHSNIDPEQEDYRSRLASENWDAPIVVTTNVMFFESLFAARTSRCRKLHNLSRSVIVLDEVQALPLTYLEPCLAALKELVVGYGSSAVVCTATQPVLDKRPNFPHGLEAIREIMVRPDPNELQNQMKRVIFHNLTDEPLTTEALAGRLEAEKQVLCIVNNKKQARDCYERLNGDAWYLSTNLCPQHRKAVLKTIRQTLKQGNPCRVVSTQLVEAGVDLDFPCVYRALAGLDAIVQAAGRCNREGRAESGRVFVFKPAQGIGLLAFKAQAETAARLLAHGAEIDINLVHRYFRDLFFTRTNFDQKHIYKKMTDLVGQASFPFRTVAREFKFIEEDQKPVIIDYDAKAKRLLETLRNGYSERKWLRDLQPYTVQVRTADWQTLVQGGAIELIHDHYPVLKQEHLYDDQMGFCIDRLGSYTPGYLVN